MITLRSDRLTVELAEINEISGCRFDRTAWVHQVTLDGTYIFCEKEPDGIGQPPTGGGGLCGEIRSAATIREAECGEWFHKFGVGRLRKPDEQPYIHYRDYECIPYEIKAEKTSENCAEFVVDTGLENGFGMIEKKRVTVEGNQLRIEHSLQNIGERETDIHEYNHNFVSLEGLSAGPGYLLEMDPLEEGEKTNEILHYQDGKLTVTDWASTPVMISVGRINGNFTWKLSHEDSSLRLSESDSFCPGGCGVWVFRQIISPEVHFFKTLVPGETCQWVRIWTFED